MEIMQTYLTCVANLPDLWKHGFFEWLEYARLAQDLSDDRRYRLYLRAYTNATGIVEYRGQKYYITRDYSRNIMQVERN